VVILYDLVKGADRDAMGSEGVAGGERFVDGLVEVRDP